MEPPTPTHGGLGARPAGRAPFLFPEPTRPWRFESPMIERGKYIGRRVDKPTEENAGDMEQCPLNLRFRDT
jgi:hypothetical protein